MKSFKSNFLPRLNNNQPLKIIPLGGVGDVTKNMYIYECGNDIIIVDCGVGFPDEAMPGVDLVIPDISYLRDKVNKIRGIFITHGHEDHIGSLPYIWPELQVPIYTQKLTAGFIRAKFTEHNLLKNKIFDLALDAKVKLGVFDVSFYQVSHSVPDSTGIVIRTPQGLIIHQADFKIDWTPVSGQVTDVGKVAQLGMEGVFLLLIDCLRVDKPGFNKSEKSIEDTFEKAAIETPGKVLITMTSSNVSRMQQAINVAEKLGRKVAVVGRSFENNFQVARDLGYLSVPPGIIIAPDSISSFAESKVLILIAGAQGQSDSSRERAANEEQRQVKLKEGDSVIFSADPIPSTESAQNALIDSLSRLGLNVYYSAVLSDLHVSVLPNTEVLIRDQQGKIKLQEIRNVDDQVEAYSFDRKYCTASWKQAKKIQHRYQGLVYKITTLSGRFVEVTKGHSLFALKNCQLIEIKSENLKVGDYLVIPESLPVLESEQVINLLEWMPKKPGYHLEKGSIFYRSRCIGPIKLKVEDKFCRLLGYYMAEGSAPRHLSIVLNITEIDLAGEIKLLISKLLKCSINTGIRGNAQEISFGTPFLGRIFKNWFGNNATSKKIPEFIFSASEKQKLNFLGAYINGDGSIDKGPKHSRIRVKTASRKLASDLLYLFSSIGIIARLDHIEQAPTRFIGKYKFKATQSYVIRIQGREYISKLLFYLSKKFQDYFNAYYESDERVSYTQTHAPEALPVREINLLEEVSPKSGTTLAQVYRDLRDQRSNLSQLLINRQIIQRDAEMIGNPLKYYLSGDLLFDPIKKIEVSEYEGPVYDLSVPGQENFLGGFGGIFLHNSGHAALEELRLMVNLIKPKFVFPIGGTFRHMEAFAKMAREMGYDKKQVLEAEDGDILEIRDKGIKIAGKVDVQNVYVDGLGIGDIGHVVLRDRQKMSEEGVVVVVVSVDQHTSQLVSDVDIISRGFVFGETATDILNEAKGVVKDALQKHTRKTADWRFIRRIIEDSLDKFLYQATERRPLILSVVVEV